MNTIIYDDFFEKSDWHDFLEEDRKKVPSYYEVFGDKAEVPRIIEQNKKNLEKLKAQFSFEEDDSYHVLAFIFDKKGKHLKAVKQLDRNLNSFLNFRIECHSIRTFYYDDNDVWERDIHNCFKETNKILFRRAGSEYDYDTLAKNYIFSDDWKKYNHLKINKDINLLTESILSEIFKVKEKEK